MQQLIRPLLVALLALFAGCGGGKPAGTLIAVAANFSATFDELAREFQAETGGRVVAATGSTGVLYAQILSGAPYSAFLAADAERPRLLEAEGLALPGSRFTYASGVLCLWSAQAGLSLQQGEILRADSSMTLAVANPELAPYGKAAEQVLSALELRVTERVLAPSVGQAFQYVASGSAKLGFVSAAQLHDWAEPDSRWQVPAMYHKPIDQQAVLLQDDPVARSFLGFLQGDKARAILAARGYRLPEDL